MEIDKQLLQQMIDERFVSVQKHPDADLFIYNYTAKAQYDRMWNDITLQCRGLILDKEINIIARPFRKFFNLEELPADEMPNEPFEVYEKLDGSLGILYWLNNEPFIATRGSFISQQALRGGKILRRKYAHTFHQLDKGVTYLFEIIYPENRIVIDYGAEDDLILLAAIDNVTGNDLPVPDIGFPIVKKYSGIADIDALKQLDEANREGFVVKFKNGLRAKLKFKEYLRIHRIVTGVSNITIWEHLAEGRPFDELLEKVPDEFYDWVKKTIDELTNRYNAILAESKNAFKQLDTRKETALYFQTQKYPSVLFAMLDDKPFDKIIWKMIRPQFSKPFKIEV
jgi:RNA ligase